MRMELAAGRDFSQEFTTDTLNVIINEAAALAMGFEDPIGQQVRVWGRDGEIIGVVKDFHIASLYDPIDPMVMRLNPESSSLTLIRPAAGQTEEALSVFETVFKEFNPEYPFEYTFVDESFERQYSSEIVIGKLSLWFTGLAIFIACLGLFGLASFSAERRTKEIGIRKVLGATIPGIVGLLSREFVVLVLLAFTIAAPISWYLMNDWLSAFEYHTDLGWGIFVSAVVGILAITCLTVGFQSIRAALANPADALRSE
ncbi:MAG: FtsX-like permease family protein [Bacteroidetes bacterium]|nr:MAG: FtsX-like permease family protein [Bacteroidota bacterium]